MQNEEWKVMEEVEGKYSISNYGRVKHNGTGLIRKIQIKNGYNRMSFHVTRKTCVTYFVHRLVAKYFIEESQKPQINHKDGNKLNNHISNLEWVTAKENSVHSSSMGLAPKGERNGQSKLKEGDIADIKNSYLQGKTRREIAARYGVSLGLIGHVVKNRSWQYLQGAK